MNSNADVSWRAAPGIAGPWKDLTPSEATAMAGRVGAAVASERLGGIASLASLQRIRAVPLPFYPQWLLVECEASLPERRTGIVAFLYGPGASVVLLDFTSRPIHEVNERALTRLDEPAVAMAYLRFFCAHIVGDEGRFRIVDGPADLPWTGGIAPAPLPDAATRIRPLAPLPRANDEAPARFSGTMLYGESLYGIQLSLGSDGAVEMTDDEWLGTLPVVPEQLAPPFRMPSEEDAR